VSELKQKHCVPCKGGVPPLKGESLRTLQDELSGNWDLIDEHHLQKDFSFKNFKDALIFTNRVGELAESEGHHPDIHLAWGKVGIETWTHKIDGLSESDFILAAKIDDLLSSS
jgi:4a-hydroxytetrahydrobiopterin dehydratase